MTKFDQCRYGAQPPRNSVSASPRYLDPRITAHVYYSYHNNIMNNNANNANNVMEANQVVAPNDPQDPLQVPQVCFLNFYFH